MNGILEIAVRPSILFISIKDRNAMTEITWTNCADAMPPDDLVEVIGRWSWNNKPELCFVAYIKIKITKDDAHEYEWTRYTPEIWEELNKLTSKTETGKGVWEQDENTD